MSNGGTTEDVDGLQEGVEGLRVETGKWRPHRSKSGGRADDDSAALHMPSLRDGVPTCPTLSVYPLHPLRWWCHDCRALMLLIKKEGGLLILKHDSKHHHNSPPEHAACMSHPSLA